jgi:hypothetical protein
MVGDFRRIAAVVACVWLSCFAFAVAEPAPFMMRAQVDGRLIEGQPLAWTQQQMLILGRDGVLYDFDPANAKDASRFGQGFVAYSAAELTGLLRQEFDANFEVSPTAHFVVVHPRGQWREWADRLESLYRSFTHYMGVRGFRLREPNVPLVAIVFRNQRDYYEHAAASGTKLQPGTLGHYDPSSNRVFLFDIAGVGGNADWSENAATIIHEATHQTAYNVGVHRRFAEQPRWAVEGLAMMFEARGVWNASSLQSQADRLNVDRLEYFRRWADERPSDWLVEMIASDKRFESDAMSAYAEAWTLTFYLCETRPQEYSAYLAKMASRGAFSEYSTMERVTDFAAVFGGDFEMLAAQLERFVAELP